MIDRCRGELKAVIEYAPTWVLVAVATALGSGRWSAGSGS